ncbi:polysaccharide deacetylase [Catenulispora acidiphila DSM 44928]|uniref:Polysaccharide deacetylase n=1 Tax=Catenulispora acidiphila (strain DSM 44928 / JCM 14897 / NBRC 102108 / NRRL B-24433 / ID139908) TaxID=479433 RepID=C7Q022_CATAD|nr:polysaccharide deacetylase family protein [Catenulispora acidiphila]ACU75515.1 polysaccharide deacetylase [Catenulispora acidiphila DSM 44928]
MRSVAVARAGAAIGVAGLGLAHIGPAASWLPPVRDRLLPALAARGRADHVALTFDDGPDPVSTPRFLDLLDELDVRATFFVLGSRVARHPEVAAETAARGHEVAVHGWTHEPQWLPHPQRDVTELRLACDVVEQTCGARPTWFRPPFGVLTTGLWRAARRAELRPVLWGAWGKDWEPGRSVAEVRETVLGSVCGGTTLLLHDAAPDGRGQAWRTTLAALPGIVESCRGAGWDVGTLAEHF